MTNSRARIRRGTSLRRGRADAVGDLVVGAWVPLLVECKAAKRSERAVWIDEARAKVERSRATAVPIIVEKRRGRSDAGGAFVTLDLDGFLDLIDRIAPGSSEPRRAGDMTREGLGDRGRASRGASRPAGLDSSPRSSRVTGTRRPDSPIPEPGGSPLRGVLRSPKRVVGWEARRLRRASYRGEWSRKRSTRYRLPRSTAVPLGP